MLWKQTVIGVQFVMEKDVMETNRYRCSICYGEVFPSGDTMVCKDEAEHIFANYDGKWKLKISRQMAIDWIKKALYSDPDGDYDVPDSMTNEELAEEICCSGMVHDEDFGEVVD